MDSLTVHFNEEMNHKKCERCKIRTPVYRVFIKNFNGKDWIVEWCFICVKSIIFVNGGELVNLLKREGKENGE